MQMFIAAEWRDGMKNSGGMRDLKSLFWTLSVLSTVPQWLVNIGRSFTVSFSTVTKRIIASITLSQIVYNTYTSLCVVYVPYNKAS